MKFLFLIFGLLLFTEGAIAQCRLQLSGRVLDTEGVEVPGAALWSDTADKGTATRSDGTFRLTELCPGQIELEIHSLGFEEKILRFNLQQDTAVQIILQTSSTMLEEVTVHQQQSHRASLTELTMSERDIMLKAGKSLAETLDDMPGVSTLPTGPNISKPVVHGLHGYRLSLVHDGIPLESQQWGQEHAPELDPYAANEIKVLKGASTVQYGPGLIGGAVLIDPNQLPEEPGIRGSLHANGQSNGRGGIILGSIAGMSKQSPLKWQLTGGYKRFGDYRAPDYNMTNTGFEQGHFRGVLAYRVGTTEFQSSVSYYEAKYGILRSAHLGNLSDLDEQIESDEPLIQEPFSYRIDNPYQDVAHIKAQVSATINRFKGMPFKVTYNFQQNLREEFDIRRGNRDDIPALDMKLTTHQINAWLDHDVGPRIHGKLGADVVYKQNRNVPGTGVRPLIPFYNETRAGMYIMERYVTDRWEFEAGLRYDADFLQVKTFNSENSLVSPDYTFHAFSGNMGARFKGKNLKSSLLFSGASRFLQVHELFSEGLHHGTGSIEQGLLIDPVTGSADGDLGQGQFSNENAYQFTYTLEGEKGAFSFDADVFLNAINDYTYLRPYNVSLTIRGAFPVFRYVQTDALFVGGDLGFIWDLTPALSWQSKGMYLWARDVGNDDQLIQVPGNRLLQKVTYTLQTNENSSTQFFAHFRSVFEQRNAPAVLTVAQLVDIALNPGLSLPESNYDYKEVPPTYHVLDLGVRHSWTLPEKQLLQLGLTVENALNTTYREYMNRFRYYTDEKGINWVIKLTWFF